MTPYTIQKREGGWIYDCFAVVNHGGDLGGGHYTSYAKHSTKNTWFLFNDQTVTQVDESKVKTSAAYILFYIRRDWSGNEEGKF